MGCETQMSRDAKGKRLDNANDSAVLLRTTLLVARAARHPFVCGNRETAATSEGQIRSLVCINCPRRVNLALASKRLEDAVEGGLHSHCLPASGFIKPN